ncbi:hypothetical protein D9758_004717 [Tetrapyrgos nigripes]|uniref:Carboxylesterase type B domain-containing protein n=1 Tax=Tetrapyrgos nigripes TaxID=182062 RepID=A0A8H5LYN2_9AGAR|nr:hypothetical protein D9758_004717 [Tetrapyrgos nigripes]
MPTNANDNLIVDLGYAKYQGVRNETSGNVRFLGVRYAKDTAGPLRWRAPQTPDSASDADADGDVQIIIADTQPPECPQAPIGPTSTSSSNATQERDKNVVESEDCLFLNVFVPGSQFNETEASGPKESLPVIVWIHGGGYHLGSASRAGFLGATGGYDGEDILQIGAGREAIVVVIQYRLGLFGFLAGSKVKEGGDLNVALHLQVHWRLIACGHLGRIRWSAAFFSFFRSSLFNNVFRRNSTHPPSTGQSYANLINQLEFEGGGSVLHHLTANDGQTNPPLFHGAMSNSMYLPPIYPHNDTMPETIYSLATQKTNCTDASDTLACLRGTDLSMLSAANNEIAQYPFFGQLILSPIYTPVIDGTFITRRPIELLAQGKINKVKKILSITNSFEGTIFTDANTTDVVGFIKDLFPTLSNETTEEVAGVYANPTMTTAEMAARIYGECVPPAFHATDIPYYWTSISSPSLPVFQNADFQKAFAQSFVTFTTSSELDPNDKFDENILPEWPLWIWANATEMVFNRTEDFQPLIKTVETDKGVLERFSGEISARKPISRGSTPLSINRASELRAGYSLAYQKPNEVTNTRSKYEWFTDTIAEDSAGMEFDEALSRLPGFVEEIQVVIGNNRVTVNAAPRTQQFQIGDNSSMRALVQVQVQFHLSSDVPKNCDRVHDSMVEVSVHKLTSPKDGIVALKKVVQVHRSFPNQQLSLIMQFKFFTVAALASLAAATPLEVRQGFSQCNVGELQCCDIVQPASAQPASTILGLLGIVIQDLTVLVGINCSPISVIGVGGNSCTAQPVCCENNSFTPLIAIGCTPININL